MTGAAKLVGGRDARCGEHWRAAECDSVCILVGIDVGAIVGIISGVVSGLLMTGGMFACVCRLCRRGIV